MGLLALRVRAGLLLRVLLVKHLDQASKRRHLILADEAELPDEGEEMLEAEVDVPLRPGGADGFEVVDVGMREDTEEALEQDLHGWHEVAGRRRVKCGHHPGVGELLLRVLQEGAHVDRRRQFSLLRVPLVRPVVGEVLARGHARAPGLRADVLEQAHNLADLLEDVQDLRKDPLLLAHTRRKLHGLLRLCGANGRLGLQV
mmetsp:Transcript_13753/g.31160  ORF Transcript_13753/g.31160 Transcript_13753/m.31160 type:complete len:201 (+) Transcript_13753:294-896(+)